MTANNPVMAIEVENRIRHSSETEWSLSFICGSSFANSRIHSIVVGRRGVIVPVFIVVGNYDISAFRDTDHRYSHASFPHFDAARQSIQRRLGCPLMEEPQRVFARRNVAELKT